MAACQAMMLRLSQLQDQGLMKDEHAINPQEGSADAGR
jgi:hypothetical protein